MYIKYQVLTAEARIVGRSDSSVITEIRADMGMELLMITGNQQILEITAPIICPFISA